jgi:hypothetical protein
LDAVDNPGCNRGDTEGRKSHHHAKKNAPSHG